jgi:hypothetical protein
MRYCNPGSAVEHGLALFLERQGKARENKKEVST